MAILELQEFLRFHQTTNPNKDAMMALKEFYGIKSNRHSKYPNLVQFKYDQIESPMSERIVQESRGIILDESHDWEVVARPFDKFFNYGEGHAPKLDWSTARVQEKVDGSLMILYRYSTKAAVDNLGLPGEWLVASSGMPDAGGTVNGFDMTFADLFWKTWKEMGLGFPDPDYWDACFMFELTSPYNRVVVPHQSAKLTFIGMRYRTGEEVPLSEEHRFPMVKSFPLQSMEDIESTFKTMDPVKQEGYIVVDASFNRVKVKHPGYVAIHHMKDGFGPKRMLELVRSNEGSEFLAHFPEWANAYETINNRYRDLIVSLEGDYRLIKDLPDQKSFALQAIKSRYPAALFARRKQQVDNMREFLAEHTQIDKLAELLDIGNVQLEGGV